MVNHTRQKRWQILVNCDIPRSSGFFFLIQVPFVLYIYKDKNYCDWYVKSSIYTIKIPKTVSVTENNHYKITINDAKYLKKQEKPTYFAVEKRPLIVLRLQCFDLNSDFNQMGCQRFHMTCSNCGTWRFL